VSNPATSMRLIVDGDGSVWSAYDDALLQRWGYPDPDFDLPSFAVRNLGAIDVSVNDNGIAVHFRWLTVKADALSGAIQLLEQLPPRSVTLRCEADGSSEQNFIDPTEAVAWIQSNRTLWIGTGARSVVTSPRKLNALSSRSLSRIEAADDSLALMFKKWRLSHGRFSEDVVNFLVRYNLLERAVITRQNPGSDVVFEHVGSGITLYDRSNPDWTYMIAGKPVVAQPDKEYGRWVAGIFHDVTERREPAFDHVDAVVRDDRGAGRFRYDRLLLPWESGGDSRLVTSLSFKTDPDALLTA
jgi:hypothetical protein